MKSYFDRLMDKSDEAKKTTGPRPVCKNCGSIEDVKAVQLVPGTTAWVILCSNCRRKLVV